MKHSIIRKIVGSILLVGIGIFLIISGVSFAVLIPRIESYAVQNTLNLNDQIRYESDKMFTQMKTAAVQIFNNQTIKHLIMEYEKTQDMSIYREIERELSGLSQIGIGIRGAAITNESGDVFTTFGLYDAFREDILPSQEFLQCQQEGANRFSHPFYYTESGGKQSCLISYYMFSPNYWKENYYFIFTFDFSEFERANNEYKKRLEQFYWVDVNGNIIWNSAESELTQEETSVFVLNEEFQKLSNSEYEKDGNDYIFCVNLEENSWRLVSKINYDDLMSNFSSLIMITLIGVSLYCALLLAILPYITVCILKPLKELSSTIRKISMENLDVHCDINSGDEFQEVADTINFMTSKIRNQLDRLLLEEREKEKAKYALLISQIDPHFIYNTLNTITYLARKNRKDDIICVNTALIRILKDTLRLEIDNVFDTIAQEIDIVERYFTIQQYRYGDDVAVLWNVEPSVLQLKIPKNILQPLVENSLYHGLLPDETNTNKKIEVFISSTQETIEIKVADNGIGIPKECLENINSLKMKDRGENIGIRNLQERLRFLYKSDFNFRIESQLGEGTSVFISLRKGMESQ